MHNLTMLQKFLDAGAYTVAGNVIYSHPKRGQMVVAFWHDGGWQITPHGDRLLAELRAGEVPPAPAAEPKPKRGSRIEKGSAESLASALDE